MFLKCHSIRRVVVADGRETGHSPILFPVPHSNQRDASGSLLSSEACVYDLSAHPPTAPVIPIITHPLNVTAEIDEFKNDVGLFLIGQQPPYVLQAMTLGQKYHLLKHHFVLSIDHTFPEELNT